MSQQSLFFDLAAPLTSSAGAGRVKTFRQPVAGRGLTGQDLDCSSRWFASCLNCETLGHQCPMCSLRTYLRSACEALSGLSLNWNRSITKYGVPWWVLGRSEPRTAATASGSWPAPDTQNVRDGRQERSVSNLQPDGTGRHGVSLHHLVASLGLRPIPSLPQAGWPTPGASDGGDGSHLMPNDASPTGRRADGSKTAVTLPGIVRMASLPSTGETTTDEPRQWGTPRVTDNGGLGYQRENHRSRLEDQVVMEDRPVVVRRRIARPSAQSAVTPPSTPISQSPAHCATDVPSSWPTPRSSDNENRMTQPAPSHGQSHGRALAGEAHRWATPREADSRNIVTSEASMNDTAERSGPSLLQQARQPADLSGRAATHEPTSSEPSATPTIISDGENWATLTQRDFRSGRASQATMERNPRPLNEQVVADASSQSWPTPNCPAPHDSLISAGRHRPNRDIQMLCDAVGRQESCDGQPDPASPSTTGSGPGLLNSAWVAQLQGWPQAYTNALMEAVAEQVIKKSKRRREPSTR